VGDDDQAVFEAHFPDPVEQAEALLEICQGDIGEVEGIATTNFEFAKYQADRIYWSRVGVLISRKERAVVMERFANNKLKRSIARK
jgi:hypothetical protein